MIHEIQHAAPAKRAKSTTSASTTRNPETMPGIYFAYPEVAER
jgi:hypothetical protein